MTPDLTTPSAGLLARLDRAVTWVEVALVSTALTLMVLLKFADVVMRNSGHGGIPEFATIAQHLVLWVGMLGATLAAAERKHISIEVLAPFLSPARRRVIEGIADVATVVVSAALAYVAIRWIDFSERPDAVAIFTVPGLGVPFRRWWSLAIIPIGFALIAVRYAGITIGRLRGVAPHPAAPPEVAS